MQPRAVNLTVDPLALRLLSKKSLSHCQITTSVPSSSLRIVETFSYESVGWTSIVSLAGSPWEMNLDATRKEKRHKNGVVANWATLDNHELVNNTYFTAISV